LCIEVNLKVLYLDVEEFLKGSILIQDIPTLTEVLDYYRSQSNASFSLVVELDSVDRVLGELHLLSFLEGYKGDFNLLIGEPISRKLIQYFDSIQKDFKPYKGLMLNSLIGKIQNPTTQTKLKEFFRNVLNARQV